MSKHYDAHLRQTEYCMSTLMEKKKKMKIEKDNASKDTDSFFHREALKKKEYLQLWIKIHT